jgi:glycosyltransferase involved in cell wall biosynthesis
MPKSLYICYFGLREPLVQTQVIPYLKEILKDGVEISLLTFEPEFKKSWTSAQIETERKNLAEQNITWHVLPYHKSPSVPATFYDVLNGTRLVRKLLASENYDILHCRVHLPALMASMARKFSRNKPKILFDIRGFFPEEYTDAGVWPEGGWLYRTAKRVERWLLKEADGFVVLTEKARDILFPESKTSGVDKLGRPVEVIPCCVDLKRFGDISEESRTETRRRLGIGDRFVIAYVGSFGGWYLSDEMFDFFPVAREADPSTFVMVLTQRDKSTVISKLIAAGFGENDFFVDSVSPNEIPLYLNAADAGVSFIMQCYSKQASSPTKNAEYLASGLPIIANSGVGDVDAQITEHNVGVIVERFDRECYLDALNRLKEPGDIRQRCRDAAKTVFDLETVGGTRYRMLYERILGQ